MSNVLFRRITTAELATEAIQDGKLIYLTDGEKKIYQDVGTTRIEMVPADSALSTTSTNPIQNQAITTSIVNDLTTAVAITTDYVPCGTKVLKELCSVQTYTVLTSDWSYSSGIAMYIATKTYTGITTNHKVVSWVKSATIPATATEISNDSLYQYAIPTSSGVVSLYASSIPSATMTIVVKIEGI